MYRMQSATGTAADLRGLGGAGKTGECGCTLTTDW